MVKVYSVFDDKAASFSTPFTCPVDAIAIRAFYDLVNNSDRLESRFPQDFHLYCLGEFDEMKGTFISTESGVPEFVAHGLNAVRPAMKADSAQVSE